MFVGPPGVEDDHHRERLRRASAAHRRRIGMIAADGFRRCRRPAPHLCRIIGSQFRSRTSDELSAAISSARNVAGGYRQPFTATVVCAASEALAKHHNDADASGDGGDFGPGFCSAHLRTATPRSSRAHHHHGNDDQIAGALSEGCCASRAMPHFLSHHRTTRAGRSRADSAGRESPARCCLNSTGATISPRRCRYEHRPTWLGASQRDHRG